MLQDRTLPHSKLAEKSVLAAMFIKPDEIIPKVQSELFVEDFYVEENIILYQAFIDLFSDGTVVDTITVAEYLRKNNLIEKIGGFSTIIGLNDAISTTANVNHHVNIIKEKSTLRKLIDAGEEIVSKAYDDSDEIENIIDTAEKRIFSITSRDNSTGEFEHISTIISRTISRINALYNSGGGLPGIATGFKDLNKTTSGLQKSDLILLAARPSMGKTGFVLNLASNIAIKSPQNRQPKKVGIFSMEMSKEQLAQRMLSTSTGIKSQDIRTGKMKKEEWDLLQAKSNEISKGNLYIDDTPGLTVAELRSRARKLKSSKGLDLVIIDYLQLMQGKKSKGGEVNRQQEISEISRALKALARELDIPVVALSQLSRAVEMRAEKRPLLSDLRESGSLEQDADIVMFLYRDDYYNKESTNQNIAELIVAKNRNGPTETIRLQFNKELIRFGELSDRNDEESNNG